MTRKLTVTLDARLYTRIRKTVRKSHISDFVGSVLSPHFLRQDLDAEYKRMAQDKEREKDALEWAEGALS
jgi:hypothetical protein